MVLLVTTQQDVVSPIVYLGTYLKERDVEFELFNIGLEEKKTNFETAFKKIIPFIAKHEHVAFSCLTEAYYDICFLIYHYYKETNDFDHTIIIGGNHPTSLPVQSITDSKIGKGSLVDVSVQGYGHETLYNLLTKPIEEVNNICYIKDGQVIKKKQTKTNPPLFEPDWSLVLDFLNKTDLLPVNYAYGCPNQCAYCNSLKPKRVTRDPTKIAIELEDYIHKYPHLKGLALNDDNTFVNLKQVEALFNALKDRGLEGIAFSYLLDPGILVDHYQEIKGLYKSIDLDFITGISLEFVDQAHIEKWNRLHKGVFRNHEVELAGAKKFVNQAPLKDKFDFNYITPCPGDTLTDYYNTLKELTMMCELRENGPISSPFFTSLKPYPGTLSYQHVTKEGLWLWDNDEEYKSSKISFLKWKAFNQVAPYLLNEQILDLELKVSRYMMDHQIGFGKDKDFYDLYKAELLINKIEREKMV